jgi:hypothetical protein
VKEKKYDFVGANLFLALGIFLLTFVALLIGLQVAFRNFFLWSIPDAIIIFENFVVLILFFPLAAIRKKHIRVNFFYEKIIRKKSIHLIGYFLAFCIGCFLWIASFQGFWSAWQEASYFEGFLQIPEFPARFFFSVSILFFVLALMQDFLKKILS